MSSSPGHRQWPDHQVREQRITGRMRVEVAGETLADSSDVVRVDEDGHPERFYFPRGDIDRGALERSSTTTECPFKGTARYFHLKMGDKVLKDAAWSYEEPYDEHMGLKDRVAFHDDKLPEIEVKRTDGVKAA